DVERHVEDFPRNHAHQLALRAPSLRVKPPQRSARRARVVVLHEVVGDAALPVLGGMESLEKEAALVAEDLGFHDQHFGKLAGQEPGHVHLSKRYPCPRTVRKWRGSSAFVSIFTRSERTKLSTVRGVPSYSAPQQRARMSSRESARPPDCKKSRSTLNSC